MAYIGKQPTTGDFVLLDSITTSATASYTMQKNSVNFTPQSANHMIVSLNGTIQAPVSSFTVSGSTLTFASALTSSDVIDFILVLGNVNDVGTATTVVDSAITKNKLNLISESSSAGLTVKGDGSSENGTIQLNCSQNSHGVKISSPAHSAGQSYELILPTGNVTADKFLKVASVSGSGTTGIGQLSFADAGGNTPAFEAKLASDMNVTDNAQTKVTCGTEVFDTDSAYDNSTNYRFTPQTSGKYYVYGGVGSITDTSKLKEARAMIYKNGSRYRTSTSDPRDNLGYHYNNYVAAIVDMNGSSDYVELYGLTNKDGGTDCKITPGHEDSTYFGAFKIGGA